MTVKDLMDRLRYLKEDTMILISADSECVGWANIEIALTPRGLFIIPDTKVLFDD